MVRYILAFFLLLLFIFLGSEIFEEAITNIANYGCGHDSRPDSQSSKKGVRLHALADTVAAPRGKVLTVVMQQVVSRSADA